VASGQRKLETGSTRVEDGKIFNFSLIEGEGGLTDGGGTFALIIFQMLKGSLRP